MPYTDGQIRNLYSRRWHEFARDLGAMAGFAIVMLVADELQIEPDRVRAALEPVSVPA